MTFIVILFAISALIWGLVVQRHLTFSLNCLLVILLGIVVGHNFYHRSLGPLPLTIDRVLWGALILQFLILAKTGRLDWKAFNATDWIVIALTGVLTISTLSHDWQYKENLPLSRLVFFNLMPIGTYFMVKHCRLPDRHLVLLFLTLAGFGCYLSLTAIAEQRGWHGLVYPRFILDPEFIEFLGRARGPFLNPVSCGIYLVTCAAATCFLWPRAGLAGKAIVATLVLTCLMATFLTLTRSVWVAAALGALIVVWIPAARPMRGAMIVAGTIVVLLAVIQYGDRLNSFKRDTYVSESEMAQSVALRPLLAHVAWKMFLDRPVAGHGFGQYTKAKKPYHYNDTEQLPARAVLGYMQHNVFLSYLTETGLLGMGLLLALLISLGLKSWRLWNSPHLPLSYRQLGLLGLVVLANYSVNGMFHDVSIITHVGALLFLTIGLVENAAAGINSIAKQQPLCEEIPQRQAA